MIRIQAAVEPRLTGTIVRQQVWDLLVEVDQAFVPPLSSRASTLSPPKERAPGSSLPVSYFESMLDERWLLAFNADRVAGVISYLEIEKDDRLWRWSPVMYVTTIAVHPAQRGQQIGDALYSALSLVAIDRQVPFLATRTWSTNDSHISVLKKRGFEEVLLVRDERKPGIDTVYFVADVLAPPSLRMPGSNDQY